MTPGLACRVTTTGGAAPVLEVEGRIGTGERLFHCEMAPAAPRRGSTTPRVKWSLVVHPDAHNASTHRGLREAATAAVDVGVQIAAESRYHGTMVFADLFRRHVGGEAWAADEVALGAWPKRAIAAAVFTGVLRGRGHSGREAPWRFAMPSATTPPGAKLTRWWVNDDGEMRSASFHWNDTIQAYVAGPLAAGAGDLEVVTPNGRLPLVWSLSWTDIEAEKPTVAQRHRTGGFRWPGG